MVAIAVAMAVTACKPAKDNSNTGKPDSNKVDSGKTDLTKVNSTKDNTAIKATTSIKNDTVKK